MQPQPQSIKQTQSIKQPRSASAARRTVRSVVWGLFDRLSGSSSRCRLCGIGVSAPNTTNMWNHLKSKHLFHYNEYERKQREHSKKNGNSDLRTPDNIDITATFILIEYTTSGQRAVVPKNWLKDGKCAWHDGGDFNNLAKAHCKPLESYPLLEARRINNYQTNVYNYAVNKLRSLEEGAHTNNSNDEPIDKKISRSPQLANNHNGVVLSNPFAASNSAYGLLTPSTSQSSSSKAVSSTMTMSIIPMAESQDDSMEFQEIKIEEFTLDSFMDGDDGNSHSSAVVSNDAVDDERAHEPCDDEDADDASSVRKLLSTVVANQQTMLKELRYLRERQEMIITQMSASVHWSAAVAMPELDDIGFHLPITCDKEYDAVLDEIVDNDKKLMLKKILQLCGGENLDALVRRMWNRLLRPDFHVRFNWSGINGKRPLERSELLAIITECCIAVYPNCTDVEVATATKTYFHKSYNRTSMVKPALL